MRRIQVGLLLAGVAIALLLAFFFRGGPESPAVRVMASQGDIYAVLQTGSGRTPDDAQGGIFRVSVGTGAVGFWTKLVDIAPGNLAVAKDGQIAFCRGGAVWLLEPEGGKRRLADGQGMLVWSPDSRRLICTDERKLDNGERKTTPWLIDVADGSAKQIPVDAGHWIEDWSPDGEHLLSIYDVANDGRGVQIRLLSLDGKLIRELTHDKVFNLHPRFSPDGKRAAFVRIRGDMNQIVIAGLDNGPAAEFGAPTRDRINQLCWSPDGRFLAVVVGGAQMSMRIFDVSAGTSADVPTPKAIWIGPIAWR